MPAEPVLDVLLNTAVTLIRGGPVTTVMVTGSAVFCGSPGVQCEGGRVAAVEHRSGRECCPGDPSRRSIAAET